MYVMFEVVPLYLRYGEHKKGCIESKIPLTSLRQAFQDQIFHDPPEKNAWYQHIAMRSKK